MRAGWNDRLRDLCQRVDQGAALIAEVVAVTDSDIKELQSHWLDADSTTGLEVLEYGGVRLQDSSSTEAEHTTDDGSTLTLLGPEPQFNALALEWTTAGDEDIDLRTFVARLHPQVNGGNPKTVATWRADVYRVARIAADDVWTVQLLRSVTQTASGSSAGDVTFDLTDGIGRGVIVGAPPEYGEDVASGDKKAYPITVLRVRALQSDGTEADNVAWMADSAEGATKAGTGYNGTIYVVDNPPSAARGTVFEFNVTETEFPRFSLTRGGYSAATCTFSGASNDLEITGSPEQLRVVAQGEEPSDSALTWQMDDGTTGWVTVYDGDVIGEDNTATGGADLSSMSTTGPWDCRVTLTPSTGGLRSPVASRLGIEGITTTDLTGVAVINGARWQVDPDTLKGNIPEATIAILKTGEKDFRDYGSDILAANAIGDLEVRVWVGDPTGEYLDRSEWMHHSTFEARNYFNRGAVHEVVGLSPLWRLREEIPPFVVTSGNDGTREPVEIANATRKAAYEEIVDTLLALPTRFRGPGVVDTSTTVTKTIEKNDAKDEMDAICFLGGEALVDSQGRAKVVPVMRDDLGGAPPAADFPLGSYTAVDITPGYDRVLDEYFVPYGYDTDKDDFPSELRLLNATATTNLGGPGLNTTERCPEVIAKWIDSSSLAEAVATRVLQHHAGMALWRIAPVDAHPHLEVGDVVTVETDQFVGRGAITGKEIRGPLYVSAIVVAVGGFWGRDLTVWVPSSQLDDIAGDSGTVTRGKFAIPRSDEGEPTFDISDALKLSYRASKAGSVKAAVSDSAFPSDATVRAASSTNLDSEGFANLSLGGSYPPGTTVYVKAFAYEKASAGGAEEPIPFKLQVTRELPEPGLSAISVSVFDDGTDDDYTFGWTPNAAVTDSMEIALIGYREGVEAITGTETSPATNTSKVLTDTGGGDGAADNHNGKLILKDSSGNVLASYETTELLSTV